MLRFLARRLVTLPLVLLILITASFFMIRMAPGDPFASEKNHDKEVQAALEAKYGLDKPLLVQYLRYLGLLLKGDLGLSTNFKDKTVNDIVAEHLPVSAIIGLTAMGLALLVGIGSGIIAAARQNSVFDYGAMTIAMVGISTPTFVAGPLLMLVFAMYLDWLPVSGWNTQYANLDTWRETLKFLVLPAVALSLPFMARISRLMRTGMLEVIRAEYIKTARAKGLSEPVVILRHAARGALLPVVSFLGPATAQILTGSLVVEKIFGVPGIGREFVESALARDYSLVLGLVVIYGTLLIVFNLIVDIAYGFLDPRISHS